MTRQEAKLKSKIKYYGAIKILIMNFYIAVKEYELLDKIQDIFHYYNEEEYTIAKNKIEKAIVEYANFKGITKLEAEKELWQLLNEE